MNNRYINQCMQDLLDAIEEAKSKLKKEDQLTLNKKIQNSDQQKNVQEKSGINTKEPTVVNGGGRAELVNEKNSKQTLQTKHIPISKITE